MLFMRVTRKGMKFVLTTIWKMPPSEFRFSYVVFILCKVLVGGLART